jgi:hypothetical protein
VLVLALVAPAPAQDVLVPAGAVWRYLDDGSDQGTAWRAPAFDDSGWASGPAQLGYGDGDEATVIASGPAGNHFITSYFRHEFTVASPGAYVTGLVRLVRDDGALVWLNGVEIARSNLPAGPIAWNTHAPIAVGGAEESAFFSYSFSPALLASGANVLAVEVHQQSGTSSDVSFDLELAASAVPFVVRGPYLQRVTPTSAVVRWRTDVPSSSRVLFGPAPGMLGSSIEDPTPTTEHELELAGLAPDTRVYYAIGTQSAVLAGDDAEHWLETAPLPGSSAGFRVWVLGDSGTAAPEAEAVRDAWLAHAGPDATDLWLMLGDNAYLSGTDVEYQAAVFDMYPSMLRTRPLWPARGNHETVGATYFGIFTLPAAGEAGGLPSGTEAYYSFDWGNVHFVCLDSFASDRSIGGAMWTWLRADLAATAQEWRIAFWHHPPYSKGSHDSDVEAGLAQMRTNFLPLLEDGGVDLVLTGHSHSYERSFLLDAHYGDSTTFAPAHQLDAGDGREDGDGAYAKDPGPHHGAVYCVAGSSGQTGGGPLDHPAMFLSLDVLGSVELLFAGSRLDVAFLDDLGAVRDRLTLLHGSSFQPYCYGDGSLGAACPCLNFGLPGRGCDNSAATGGAALGASGDPLANDVVLLASGLPPAGAPTVLAIRSGAREAGGLGTPFGDGLLCVAPPVVRLGATFGAGGAASLPISHGAGAGLFHYQLWYRNSAPFCLPEGFNLSNGLSIAWP